MFIGTPLSPNATRVMLLGSGELGKEVMIALQRLGVEVIAVDRYEKAPGHQVAHRSHVIDMTNREALLHLVNLEKPNYIIPEIEAINTDVLAHIEKSGDAIDRNSTTPSLDINNFFRAYVHDTPMRRITTCNLHDSKVDILIHGRIFRNNADITVFSFDGLTFIRNFHKIPKLSCCF